MKILILIIYSDNFNYYNKMYELQNEYLNNHENIDVFFVKCNNEQNETVVKCGNKLIVKGNETYLNITYKTMTALNYIINECKNNYDYIIRSNISTLININKLCDFLNECPKYNLYTGSVLLNLQWFDEPFGINAETNALYNLIGLRFIRGNSIIMSIDVVICMLNNISNLNYKIVDDVTFGLFLRNYRPDIYNNIDCIKLCQCSNNKYDDNSVFIRNKLFDNKNIDRVYDIEFMDDIVHFFYKPMKFKQYNITKTTKIPNNIYLIHKDIGLLTKSASEWQQLNPNYNIHLYDDEKCLAFLFKFYGQKFCDIFNFIKDWPIKCDFFRVCVLYIYGGVYANADILPLVPLNDILTDDIDFATCISYNYKTNINTWSYNPQFIVSQNFDTTLQRIINHYVTFYVSKIEYSYCKWSIYALFEKIHDFDIDLNGDNVFMHANKKYKFFIEEFINNDTQHIFNFSNYSQFDAKSNSKKLTMYVKNKDTTIFYNFKNKNIYTTNIAH
jgi:hypothetical protein